MKELWVKILPILKKIGHWTWMSVSIFCVVLTASLLLALAGLAQWGGLTNERVNWVVLVLRGELKPHVEKDVDLLEMARVLDEAERVSQERRSREDNARLSTQIELDALLGSIQSAATDLESSREKFVLEREELAKLRAGTQTALNQQSVLRTLSILHGLPPDQSIPLLERMSAQEIVSLLNGLTSREGGSREAGTYLDALLRNENTKKLAQEVWRLLRTPSSAGDGKGTPSTPGTG